MSVGKELILGNHFHLRNDICMYDICCVCLLLRLLPTFISNSTISEGEKKKILFLATGKNFNEDSQFTKSPEICEVSLSLSLVTKLYPSFAIPWTVACQAPLSMGSSRQEYKSGLPFPSPLQSLSSAKITFITGGFSLPCSHWEGEWYSAVSAQYRQVQPE